MNSLQMFTACVVLSISTSSANGIEIYRSGYGGIQQFTESGWSDPLFFTREPIAFGPDGSLYFNNDYAFSKYNITTGELTTLVPRAQTVSDLLYGVAIWDSPTMVPIPGAAWLLGSGMLCLIGITKNKTSSATIYL